VTLPPWDYLFLPFHRENFPDLFNPVWIASLVLLVALIVLYNVRTRRLHRHAPYLEMWEWLLWTGLITFSLLIIEALFIFDFFLVLATMFIGLGMLAWIRFRKFPPVLAAYEHRLARQQALARTRGQVRGPSGPDATIRPKANRRRRRR
jgi:hypothetical protein